MREGNDDRLLGQTHHAFQIGAESFDDFVPGDILRPAPGVVIATAGLNHPGGCVGYRIEWEGKSLAFVYDIERRPGKRDPVALSLMADADLVVYDSAYLDEEMEVYEGFGHSTWQQAFVLRGRRVPNRSCLFIICLCEKTAISLQLSEQLKIFFQAPLLQGRGWRLMFDPNCKWKLDGA